MIILNLNEIMNFSTFFTRRALSGMKWMRRTNIWLEDQRKRLLAGTAKEEREQDTVI